jgi:hypothetical protein
MSAVIGDPKRIESKIPLELYELIRSTGKSINDAVNDALMKEYYGEKVESDCEEIKSELGNRVLAAESKIEARDLKISELSNIWIENEKTISNLKAKLKKLTTPEPKTWPNYLFGIPTQHIWLILVGLCFGTLIMSVYYMFIN